MRSFTKLVKFHCLVSLSLNYFLLIISGEVWIKILFFIADPAIRGSIVQQIKLPVADAG